MGLYELRQKLNGYDFSRKVNSSGVGRAVDIVSHYTPRPSTIVGFPFYVASALFGCTSAVAAVPAFAMGAEDNENLDILLLPSMLCVMASEGFDKLGDNSREKVKKLERICFGSRGY
jgi:hypothetical protein